MFFGQCVPHDGVTVMPYSVDAGGLGCPVGMSGSGMGMLLGSRTATPQRLLWRGSMPMRGGRSWVAGRIVWRVVV